jgi:hypothetical protein
MSLIDQLLQLPIIVGAGLLIGLVTYLILAYSDPFQGATGIEPTSLEYVLNQIRSPA